MLTKEELKQFVDIFYEKFFESAPFVEMLFNNTDINIQKDELEAGVTYIFSILDKPDVLEKYLLELGQRHVAYQVKNVHYVLVEDCLVESMIELKKDNISDEDLAQWKTYVKIICAKMKEGAVQVVKAS